MCKSEVSLNEVILTKFVSVCESCSTTSTKDNPFSVILESVADKTFLFSMKTVNSVKSELKDFVDVSKSKSNNVPALLELKVLFTDASWRTVEVVV